MKITKKELQQLIKEELEGTVPISAGDVASLLSTYKLPKPKPQRRKDPFAQAYARELSRGTGYTPVITDPPSWFYQSPSYNRDEGEGEDTQALLAKSAALRLAAEDLLNRPRFMPSKEQMSRLKKEWGESEWREQSAPPNILGVLELTDEDISSLWSPEQLSGLLDLNKPAYQRDPPDLPIAAAAGAAAGTAAGVTGAAAVTPPPPPEPIEAPKVAENTPPPPPPPSLPPPTVAQLPMQTMAGQRDDAVPQRNPVGIEDLAKRWGGETLRRRLMNLAIKKQMLGASLGAASQALPALTGSPIPSAVISYLTSKFLEESVKSGKQTQTRTKQMKITKEEIMNLISEELRNLVQEEISPEREEEIKQSTILKYLTPPDPAIHGLDVPETAWGTTDPSGALARGATAAPPGQRDAPAEGSLLSLMNPTERPISRFLGGPSTNPAVFNPSEVGSVGSKELESAWGAEVRPSVEAAAAAAGNRDREDAAYQRDNPGEGLPTFHPITGPVIEPSLSTREISPAEMEAIIAALGGGEVGPPVEAMEPGINLKGEPFDPSIVPGLKVSAPSGVVWGDTHDVVHGDPIAGSGYEGFHFLKEEASEEEIQLAERLIKNNGKSKSKVSWSDVRDKFSKHLK